ALAKRGARRAREAQLALAGDLDHHGQARRHADGRPAVWPAARARADAARDQPDVLLASHRDELLYPRRPHGRRRRVCGLPDYGIHARLARDAALLAQPRDVARSAATPA